MGRAPLLAVTPSAGGGQRTPAASCWHGPSFHLDPCRSSIPSSVEMPPPPLHRLRRVGRSRRADDRRLLRMFPRDTHAIAWLRPRHSQSVLVEGPLFSTCAVQDQGFIANSIGSGPSGGGWSPCGAKPQPEGRTPLHPLPSPQVRRPYEPSMRRNAGRMARAEGRAS